MKDRKFIGYTSGRLYVQEGDSAIIVENGKTYEGVITDAPTGWKHFVSIKDSDGNEMVFNSLDVDITYIKKENTNKEVYNMSVNQEKELVGISWKLEITGAEGMSRGDMNFIMEKIAKDVNRGITEDFFDILPDDNYNENYEDGEDDDDLDDGFVLCSVCGENMLPTPNTLDENGDYICHQCRDIEEFVNSPIHEPGICPVCGSENLDYEVDFLEGNQIGYPWDCKDCGASGEEWYSMEFIEHANIVEKSKKDLRILHKNSKMYIDMKDLYDFLENSEFGGEDIFSEVSDMIDSSTRFELEIILGRVYVNLKEVLEFLENSQFGGEDIANELQDSVNSDSDEEDYEEEGQNE